MKVAKTRREWWIVAARDNCLVATACLRFRPEANHLRTKSLALRAQVKTIEHNSGCCLIEEAQGGLWAFWE